MARRLGGETVESNVTYPVLCKDGSYKWVESMIATDVGTEMIYVVLEDITQKRINEEKLAIYNQKLKEDEEQIQAIFNGAPDPVIVIDAESLVLKWNPKAADVFGWEYKRSHWETFVRHYRSRPVSGSTPERNGAFYANRHWSHYK